MKRRLNIFPFLTLLVILIVSGCATVPIGPSVSVMPGTGKSFEQFQADDAVCRQWAAQQIGQTTQQTINQNTVAGAAVGTVIGAGLGAAIGAASGNPGIGAAHRSRKWSSCRDRLRSTRRAGLWLGDTASVRYSIYAMYVCQGQPGSGCCGTGSSLQDYATATTAGPSIRTAELPSSTATAALSAAIAVCSGKMKLFLL